MIRFPYHMATDMIRLTQRIVFITTALLLCMVVNAQVSVLTQHNNYTRSGWNNKETILKPSTVNVRQFGKIFSVPVDDDMFAQVLILSNVNIAGGIHNIAVACTVNNTIYVFDADNGNIFWTKNFTPPGLRPVLNTDFGKCNGDENVDISRNVGIISTPVIDSSTQTLYFVSRATDADSTGNGNYYTYLHAVNIRNGNEKSNSPVSISGSVAGSAPDAVKGLVPFNPRHQNQRLALTLYNGIVLVGFSSHCDWLPYHGWIFGYDAATLKRKIIYNVTPDASGGGIWESGGGIAIDNNGYMYITTGNAEEGGIGTAGDPFNLSNRAQSAIKLKITDTALIPVDFFTPSNYKALNDGADLDYGSMASFLIPNSHFYFTGAKDGNIYFLNTNKMGGFHAAGDKVAQTISLGTSVFLRGNPSYYRSNAHEFAYVWSEQSQLKAIPFNRSTNSFDLSKLKTGLISIDKPSANISTSSNNLKDGSGIVWINQPGHDRIQILTALDANDITKELWNSELYPNRDTCGGYMKFAVPTIANGKVYLANNSGAVNVFGILDTVPQRSDCQSGTILSTGKTSFASSAATKQQAFRAFDLNTASTWTSKSSAVEWLTVDLGSIDSVCSVSLQWKDTMYAKDFLLQVSNDSANWKTIKSVQANNSKYNGLSMKTAGRYVRVYCTAGIAASGYSIKEFTVYGRTLANCETPQGLTVNMIDTASAVIRWNLVSKATGYSVKFKPESFSSWQSFNVTTDSLRVTGLSCNNYYQYAVQSKCGVDTSLVSRPGMFNTQSCESCIIPSRTYQADIGNVGIPGQACFFSPNNYFVNGSGSDIGGTADECHFVYKDFTGSGNAKVQVIGLDLVDTMNKAGLMFREDISADARFVFMGVTSSKKAVFISRATKGANATINKVTGFPVPCYVKIVKEGTLYSGLVSPDNKTWTLVGSTTNDMSDADIYVGPAVTSHNNTTLSNAKFKGLLINATGFAAQKSLLVSNDANAVIKRQSMNFKIYPNPASKSFSLDFIVQEPGGAVVSFIEVGTGRIVYTENLLNFSGLYHKVFTDATVRKGNYIVALKTSEGVQTIQLKMD